MSLQGIKYLTAYTIPLSALIGVYLGGFWLFLTPLYAFGFIPLVEIFLPKKVEKLSQEEIREKKIQKRYDWMLYANVIWIYGVLIYGIWTFQQQHLSLFEITGLVISVGIVLGSNGINVAHELGHRSQKFENFLASLLLLPSFYMHFTIEHNYGHHQKVSTPEDPATARYNQSLYGFWWQSVIGQIKNAIRLQKKFLQDKNRSWWSIHNSLLGSFILEFIYAISLFLLLGWQALLFILLSGMIGFLLLETINYIEHYGLMRLQRKSGRYYPVKNIHSWNSNHRLGRIVLYELTRHSDHHFRSSKKYQLLDHHNVSPQLPYGYPMSMIIALVPPLWFQLMNPRIPQEMKAVVT